MHCLLAVVGLFFALMPVAAQRPGGKEARHGMERIDSEEGARRLGEFRQQRLDGDYVFEFQLQHKPHRSSKTIRYDGIMWGTWNERGALTRFKILPDDENADSSNPLLDLIVQNGSEPSAWIRNMSSGLFELAEGDELFKPLLPGLVYSIYDLQMPFIYWDDFLYEGPSLVGASRVAQNFLMIPPEGSASAERGIKGVRIGLDDTYNALWRVVVIGEDEKELSRFAVESFKKVQEQYIVKRITITDVESKDRTTFNVADSSVGLRLDDDVFRVPEIPASSSENEDRSPLE
ncbi:MAG: hypothetical protein ACPGSB_09020 [Opitutales bacterium]